MQAVADNFPIIVTAALLSLALCWWGLSHYVIASRNLDQDQAENAESDESDSKASSNSQFASRQAVERQSQSRNRMLKRGTRISAELKSVAALQVQIRQRRQFEQNAHDTARSMRINNARLNINATMETPLVSAAVRGNKKQGLPVAVTESRSANQTASTTVDVTGKHNRVTNEKDTSVDSHLAGTDNTSGQTNTSVPTAATPTAAARDHDHNRARDNKPVAAQTPTTVTTSAATSAATNAAIETTTLNTTTTVAEKTTPLPGARPAMKARPEKIHHATTASSTKIASANNKAAERNRKKPGVGPAETSEPNTPKVAAYKMPKGFAGSAKSLNPLTEVKTRVSTAAASDSNFTNQNQATANADDTKQKSSIDTTVTTANTDGSAEVQNLQGANAPGITTQSAKIQNAPAQASDATIGIKTQSLSAIRKLLGGQKQGAPTEDSKAETNADQTAQAGASQPDEQKDQTHSQTSPAATGSKPFAQGSAAHADQANQTSSANDSKSTNSTQSTPGSADTRNTIGTKQTAEPDTTAAHAGEKTATTLHATANSQTTGSAELQKPQGSNTKGTLTQESKTEDTGSGTQPLSAIRKFLGGQKPVAQKQGNTSDINADHSVHADTSQHTASQRTEKADETGSKSVTATPVALKGNPLAQQGPTADQDSTTAASDNRSASPNQGSPASTSTTGVDTDSAITRDARTEATKQTAEVEASSVRPDETTVNSNQSAANSLADSSTVAQQHQGANSQETKDQEARPQATGNTTGVTPDATKNARTNSLSAIRKFLGGENPAAAAEGTSQQRSDQQRSDQQAGTDQHKEKPGLTQTDSQSVASAVPESKSPAQQIPASQTDQATTDSQHTDNKTAEGHEGHRPTDVNTASSLPVSGIPGHAKSPKDKGTSSSIGAADHNTGKYQTAAKQMSPQHEAQLQLKTADVRIDTATGTGKQDTSANTDTGAKTDNQGLTVSALSPQAIDTNSQSSTSTSATGNGETSTDAPTAFSGADDLETTLALEAKDQLIEELKARVAQLETQGKEKNNAVAKQADTSDYQQRLEETTEELHLSNQKVGKLQSTLQALQSRTSHSQLTPPAATKSTAHNRALLSSKVRVLDVRSVS